MGICSKGQPRRVIDRVLVHVQPEDTFRMLVSRGSTGGPENKVIVCTYLVRDPCIILC